MYIKLMLQDPAAMNQFANWPDNVNPLTLFSQLSADNEIAKQNQPKQNVFNIPAKDEKKLSPEVTKKLEKAWHDMFFGIAWRQWMQPGTSLARAWMGAYDIMSRKLTADFGKEYPNNPGCAHLKEYAMKKKMETIAFVNRNEHTKNPMKIPPNEIAQYAAIGDKAYAAGAAGLNAELRKLPSQAKNAAIDAQKIPMPQMPPHMLHLLRTKYYGKVA